VLRGTRSTAGGTPTLPKIRRSASSQVWIDLTDRMRTNSTIHFLRLVLAVACVSLVGSVTAKEIHSNGLGGGRWSDASTWRGGAVPGAEDEAVIGARDIVLFDRDDADKPTCKALILDPNSNFAFQGGLGKRTLTVSGPIEIPGSPKMHAQGASDDMAIQLCATVAAERVIKLERGGALMVAGRPALAEGKRNARISITAPTDGKVVPAGELTAGNRTMIDLQSAQIDHIAVTATGIDNTGAKPNERCNFTGNLFSGHARLAVHGCDTPMIARNTFDVRKVPLVRPAGLQVGSSPLADIRDNRVLGPYAIGISVSTSECSVTGITVEDCAQGIVWHAGTAMLKDNTIRNCKTGLSLRTITGSAEDTFIDGCELPVSTASAKAQLTNVTITNPPATALMEMTASSVSLLNCNVRPEQIKSTRDRTLPRNVNNTDPAVEALSFLVVQLKGDVPRGAKVQLVTTKPAAPLAPGAQDPNVRNSPAALRPDGLTPLPQTLTPLVVKTWRMNEDGSVVPAPEYTLTVSEPSTEPGAKPHILKTLKIKPDDTWHRPKPNDLKPTLEVELP